MSRSLTLENQHSETIIFAEFAEKQLSETTMFVEFAEISDPKPLFLQRLQKNASAKQGVFANHLALARILR